MPSEDHKWWPDSGPRETLHKEILNVQLDNEQCN